MRAVDLDLDVIRGTTGRVWVDDEDEFAEHRVSLGYPDEVIEQAITSCQSVLAAVEDGGGPLRRHPSRVDRPAADPLTPQPV